MDKLLQSTRDLICSADQRKILKGIEQTGRLTEIFALAFFELARREVRRHAGIDADAIEAAIAATTRDGLNREQLAAQLAVLLNQRGSLTETQYAVAGELLDALRQPGALPELRKNNVIQLEAFQQLASCGAEPGVRRRLARGLFDWRGRQRPDTTALLAQLPFLAPVVERYKRPAPLSYPALVGANMAASFKEGRASAGFFCVFVLLLAAVAISIARRPAKAQAQIPAVVEPAAASDPEPPSPAALLQKAIANPAALKRLEQSTVLILDDPDAPLLGETLTQLGVHVICANGAFGPAPEGCQWLELDDLKLLKSAAVGDKPIVACFKQTKGGKQIQFVALATRELVLAVTLGDGAHTELATVTAPSLLAEADDYAKCRMLSQASLAFRKAESAALWRPELGRVHRRWAAFLHSQDPKNTEEIARHLRLAAIYLPAPEWLEVPEPLRREFHLDPDLAERERLMTTTTIPPAAKEKTQP